MSTLQETQDDFLRWFDGQRDSLQKGCDRLAEFVEDILADGKVMFHAVQARVKKRDSIIRKLRKKTYMRPREELTDVIGIRIYTYFREDTPSVEQVIRARFEVDERRSIDKASVLKPREFGYTSRHLICRVFGKTEYLTLRKQLSDVWFEVQIRTVLEHAWAEIEHELVYKAETDVPDPIRRRFNAAAAALEIVDHEFAQLRQFEKQLIAERSKIIATSTSQKLNRTWFLACLSSSFPSPVTWDPNPELNAFYRDKEIQILEVLSDLGVETVAAFSNLLRDLRILEAIKRYAALKSRPMDAPSHLVVSLVACALACHAVPPYLSDLFDEELCDVVASILMDEERTAGLTPEVSQNVESEEQAEQAVQADAKPRGSHL